MLCVYKYDDILKPMIQKDQPTIFGSSLQAGVSSVEDGNMKFGIEASDQTLKNRQIFLKKVGIDIAHTTLVSVTYDTDDFAKYRTVAFDEKTAGMKGKDTIAYADALVVDRPNHALFLPLADCVGAILYDAKQRILMVSHLGRHSVEVGGARKSVEYMKNAFGTVPGTIRVWLSPAVGSATYPLHAFEGRGLHEVIVAQLQDVGVFKDQIEVSAVDTAHDRHYFSHSQALKSDNNSQGRFAIVAMMNVQGEPAA